MIARPPARGLPLAAVAGCGAGSNLAATDLGAPPDQAAAPRLRVANDRAYLGALDELLAGARREVWAVHFELNRDAEGNRIVSTSMSRRRNPPRRLNEGIRLNSSTKESASIPRPRNPPQRLNDGGRR